MNQRQLSAVVVAAAVLAATGYGVTAVTITPAAGGAGFSLDALIAHSDDLGRLGPAERAAVDLLLEPGPSSLARAGAIYDPGSSAYQSFVAPERLADGVGPDPDGAARALAQLRARGLEADWAPAAPALTVSAPAAAIHATFGLEVHRYRARSGQLFTAARGRPRLPPGLDPVVREALPISTYDGHRRAAVPQGGLSATSAHLLYDTRPLLDAGVDGRGETISIWALGDGFNQATLDDWAKRMRLPPVRPIVKGGSPSAREGNELMLDIEAVHTMAPGAQVFVYTESPGEVFNTVTTLTNFYNLMLRDNPRGIWSMSWGGCELADSPPLRQLEAELYARAAAAGVSVFHASGDAGAYDCMTQDWGAPPGDRALGVELEASLPMGVTAVGGTRVSVRQDGSYFGEVAWSEPLTTQGTGGGLSHFFPQPTWQRGPNVDANAFNPGRMRMVPDVAADADPTTGLTIEAQGSLRTGGGTSLATPLWAGITALLNQYLKSRGLRPVGFLSPALYDLAAGKPPYPPFHDVALGTNLRYPAGPGYDLATGLGSPDVFNLARDLEAYQRDGGRI